MRGNALMSGPELDVFLLPVSPSSRTLPTRYECGPRAASVVEGRGRPGSEMRERNHR